MKTCKVCGIFSETYPNRRICKKCYQKCVSIWRLENVEKTRKYVMSYRERNLEMVKERNRDYKRCIYQERKISLSERYNAWKEKNTKLFLDYQRKYRQSHQEERNIYSNNRRAKIKGNGGFFTISDWKNLCLKYENKCLRCGQEKKLSPDHIVPISKGGTSNIDNIQPLCQKCNMWKKDKTIDFRNQNRKG